MPLDDFQKPIRVYYQYKNFFSSHFIFAKNQELGDVYNTIGVFSRLDDCYPVRTASEFTKASNSYGLKTVPSTISSLTNKNQVVFPCGIKAMLFNYLDTLTFRNQSGAVLDLNTSGLVNRNYFEYISPLDGKYDWTEGKYRTNPYFTWIVPQVPVEGTFFFLGRLDTSVNGNISVIIDKTFPSFSGKVTRKIYFFSGEQSFSSDVMVAMSFALFIFIVGLVVTYIVIQRVTIGNLKAN